MLRATLATRENGLGGAMSLQQGEALGVWRWTGRWVRGACAPERRAPPRFGRPGLGPRGAGPPSRGQRLLPHSGNDRQPGRGLGSGSGHVGPSPTRAADLPRRLLLRNVDSPHRSQSGARGSAELCDPPAHDGKLLPEESWSEQPVGDPFLWTRLCRAMDGLPERKRDVLLLHDVLEHTHGEIGEMLGCAEITSRSQLSRARARMRVALAEWRSKEVA